MRIGGPCCASRSVQLSLCGPPISKLQRACRPAAAASGSVPKSAEGAKAFDGELPEFRKCRDRLLQLRDARGPRAQAPATAPCASWRLQATLGAPCRSLADCTLPGRRARACELAAPVAAACRRPPSPACNAFGCTLCLIALLLSLLRHMPLLSAPSHAAGKRAMRLFAGLGSLPGAARVQMRTLAPHQLCAWRTPSNTTTHPAHVAAAPLCRGRAEPGGEGAHQESWTIWI